jgi:acyl carrier protein
MANVQGRLQRCFAAVFPSLTADEIAQASPQTVAAWDSVASVTLFAIVEEEFGLEIDVQDMKDLVSFKSLLNYLQRECGGAASS